MRIKEHPEDFRVEELIELPPDRYGDFALWRLTKREWNTVDALRVVADAAGIPFGALRYAGKKDRYACTVQYITAPADVDLTLEREKFQMDFVGYVGSHLSSAALQGNAFHVVLRDLSPGEGKMLGEKFHAVCAEGFPNYYDRQRFGNMGPGGEFLADYMVRRDFEGALRFHFTACHPSASPMVRRNRTAMAKAWGDWRKIAALAPNRELRTMARRLEQDESEQGRIDALRVLSAEMLGMAYSSFQSMLWNETLARLIKRRSPTVHFLDGTPGTLLTPVDTRVLSGVSIPVVAADMPKADPEVEEAIEDVLHERGLSKTFFHLPEIPHVYFGSFLRPARVVPESCLSMSGIDERHPGKERLVLDFSLPPGSYATMLLRVISGNPQIGG